MYIDSHAHLTCDTLYPDVDAILTRAQEKQVKAIVNICTNKTTLERGLVLAKKYPWVFNAAATTPHDVQKEGEEMFPLMEECARGGHLVAVGETGLDYHYNHSLPDLQKAFLIRYLQLALSTKLPIIIHCREAFADLFEIIDAEYKGAPGVLHCFTGTTQEARQVLDRGWVLSLSGIVTFKKSEELREVAKLVPLDKLLIETDSPYLAPQIHRGKTNEPSFLPEVAHLIAQVKGLTPEEVAAATTHNAKHFFSI